MILRSCLAPPPSRVVTHHGKEQPQDNLVVSGKSPASSLQQQEQALPFSALSSSSQLHLHPVVTDKNFHLQHLHSTHSQLPTFSFGPRLQRSTVNQGVGTDPQADSSSMFRKPHGGIFPVSQDPVTGHVFVLLGVDQRGYFNDFHGLIDESETVDQGSAREGWEESKAVFGDLATLWRAVTLKGMFSVIVGNPRKNMHLINLGPLNFVERSALCAKFQQEPGWSRCSKEVKAVRFFDLKSLQAVCMDALNRYEKIARNNTTRTGGGDDDDDDKSEDCYGGTSNNCSDGGRNKHDIPRREGAKILSEPVSSISKGKVEIRVVVNYNEHSGVQECLRSCLAEGMCDRRFWSQEIFVDLLIMGRRLQDYVLPLSMLPKLDRSDVESLPFRKNFAPSPSALRNVNATGCSFGRLAPQQQQQQQQQSQQQSLPRQNIFRASSSAVGSRSSTTTANNNNVALGGTRFSAGKFY